MKYFYRALAALVIVVVAVLLGVYQLVSRSLPELDGNVALAGIDAPVTIERDVQGIATIRGASRADVAFGTGYAHAQDRFFQMDLSRRAAAGELSALVGGVALDVDKRNRLHRFRTRAANVMTAVPAEQVAIIEAYARGVNAGLASLGGKPFEYELLQVEPQVWRPEDAILVGYSMFMVLNDQQADEDIRRGMAHDHLPDELYDWMYPAGTEWDAPMQGDASPQLSMPDASVIDLSAMNAMRADHFYEQVLMPGSNNWAVSGDLTATGRAMVANDMHLGIRVPNTFYRARFIVDGVSDVTGVSLPGTPVIVSGSSGGIAWGFTNSNGDWSDAIAITPGDDADSYLTPDGPRRFVTHQETIEVKDGENVSITVRETIWGPVLNDHPYPGREFAVRWIAHDPAAVNINHLGLESAASVDEALQIASTLGMPPQNFVVGDADGNIAWTMTGKIPSRTAVDSTIPVDGSVDQAWDGWLPADQYPQIVNPASGRIWTANARVVDGVALQRLGDGGYDLGARAAQIRDGLFARDSFELADMLAIQVDDRAIFLDRWRNLVLALLDNAALAENPDREQYRQLIDDWIPRASAESVGYRLVREYRVALSNRVFDVLTTPVRQQLGESVELLISNQFEAPLWELVTQRPEHLLTNDIVSWDALMLEVVDEEIARYRNDFAGDLSDRTWGERTTARIRHPLSGAVGFLSSWLDMPPDPLGGDSNLPKAMGASFGASERFGVSPGDERNAYLHMPTGQSGHPLSDFYSRGHDDWVQGRPTSFLPGDTAHVLTLSPAD